VKTALDARMKDGTIRPKDGVGMAQFYEGVMRGYTYLHGMEAEGAAASAEDSSAKVSPPPTGS